MNPQHIKSYRSYLMMHCETDVPSTPKQPSARIIAIEEIAGERRRWEFSTVEQVMSFLVDEWLGQPTQPVVETSGE